MTILLLIFKIVTARMNEIHIMTEHNNSPLFSNSRTTRDLATHLPAHLPIAILTLTKENPSIFIILLFKRNFAMRIMGQAAGGRGGSNRHPHKLINTPLKGQRKRLIIRQERVEKSSPRPFRLVDKLGGRKHREKP